MTNPCCCALREGVFIIAIFEMVSCILSLGIKGYAIAIMKAVEEEGRIGTALGICVDLAHIAIGIVLFIGVQTNDRSKCRFWFVANIILRVFGFCLAVFGLIAFDAAAIAKENNQSVKEVEDDHWAGIFLAAIFVFLLLLLEFYLLYVVHCFIQELDAGLYMVGGGGLVGGGGAGGAYPVSQQPSYYQPAYNAPNYSQADFYSQQQTQPPQYNPNPNQQALEQPQQVQQQQVQQQQVQYGQN